MQDITEETYQLIIEFIADRTIGLSQEHYLDVLLSVKSHIEVLIEEAEEEMED